MTAREDDVTEREKEAKVAHERANVRQLEVDGMADARREAQAEVEEARTLMGAVIDGAGQITVIAKELASKLGKSDRDKMLAEIEAKLTRRHGSGLLQRPSTSGGNLRRRCCDPLSPPSEVRVRPNARTGR